MSISSENFKFIQGFARDIAAIVLEPGKEYLAESRLAPLATQAGFATLDGFIHQLRTNPKATRFQEQVIDALTTNETSFFRDSHPFEALKEYVLPRLIAQQADFKRLAIWSGASSTGQEPYTIAILIREFFPQLHDWNITILGTDISPTVLAQAKEGSYSQLEVSRGLPASFLLKYFTRIEDRWTVKDEVRKLVEFRQLNLAKPWPMLPAFDVVFLRNVMIYFDVETRRNILAKVRQCLRPQGYLFLGAAETTTSIDSEWLLCPMGKVAAYQAKAALRAAA